MEQYMLSVHSGNGAPREPTSPGEMQESWIHVNAIEEDLHRPSGLRRAFGRNAGCR
jgi:hypothetical protein